MTTNPVTPATRTLVTDRSAGFCEVCGHRAGSNIHHRAPRGMGGTKRNIHTPEWLLHVCGSGTTGCHGYIESHRDEAYTNGWLLRASADPSTPALLYRHTWVILTPDGGYDIYDIQNIPDVRGRLCPTAEATADLDGTPPEPLF